MSRTRAYEQNQVPAPGNPQQNEAWALIEAARRMAAVIEFGDLGAPADKRKMRDALRLNLRIWTIIQAELALGETELPDAIRLNILTLCKFIDQRTAACMIEPTPERVVPLIDINRNIAAGLLGSVSDDDLMQTAAQDAPATREEEQGASSDEEEASEPRQRPSLAVDI